MGASGGECKPWVLRLFAISWGAISVLAACLLAQHFPETMVWILPLGLAVACVVGLCFPALLRRPYRRVEQLLGPVGQLFSFIVLGVVFFGVFTPVAVFLRWRGWDPLRLKRENRGASAWIDRPKASERSDYRWQY
jgi:hypothetical protein